MQNELACAFTGHRPSSYTFCFDEEHPYCLQLKVLMSKQIEILIKNGVTTFLSGMALGADIWGAELVQSFKERYPNIRLIAILPCETQADKWSVEHRERYFNILTQCDKTVYISSHYTNDCMFQRNRWLIDHAKFILAIYNGIPKKAEQPIRFAMPTLSIVSSL